MLKKKLIYIHIPKCGGQTMLSVMSQTFGHTNVLKIWQPPFTGKESTASVEKFLEMDLEKILSYHAITGHISYEVVKNKLGDDLLKEYLICSIIRDPVDRTLSLWNYVMQNPNLPQYKDVSKITFEEFVLKRTFNDQCFYISQNRDANTAIKLINSDFDLVVSLSDSQLLIDKICNVFNHSLSRFEVQNESVKLINKGMLKQEVIDYILKRNSQDRILYEYISNIGLSTKNYED